MKRETRARRAHAGPAGGGQGDPPGHRQPRPGTRKERTSGPVTQRRVPAFRESSGRRALETGCSLRDPGPKATAQLARRPPRPWHVTDKSRREAAGPGNALPRRETDRKGGDGEAPQSSPRAADRASGERRSWNPREDCAAWTRRCRAVFGHHLSPPRHLGQVVTSPSSVCETRPVTSTPARYREGEHEMARPDPRRT